jgi:hypothetical protein
MHCNIEARSRNHCCGGNKMSITYSECVSVDLVVQHLKLMRPIIGIVICGLTDSTNRLIHKGNDFRKEVIDHQMYVLIFSTTFF